MTEDRSAHTTTASTGAVRAKGQVVQPIIGRPVLFYSVIRSSTPTSHSSLSRQVLKPLLTLRRL